MLDLVCSIVSLFMINATVDRRNSGLEVIQTPLDIKFEIIAALILLMLASIRTYMGKDSLQIIAITSAFANK